MCRLMEKVVPQELRESIFVYLDDLLIMSENFDEHIRLLEILSKHLHRAKLMNNLEEV